MENELIIVNNNELELTKEGIKFIKKVQKAKVELAKMEEQLKNMFQEEMEKNNIKKYTSPDGTFKATYYEETTTNRFDSTKFKKENEELYNQYLVPSTRKAYVKFN
jgi:hypothetical protein|nr:MAG TPA: hypothetical protein [Caudoviricetes sp.]